MSWSLAVAQRERLVLTCALISLPLGSSSEVSESRQWNAVKRYSSSPSGLFRKLPVHKYV